MIFTSLYLEKDKTQRQFKMYREAKEKEVQSILKQMQTLTTQLRKFVNTDGSVQDFLLEGNDIRQQCQSISEWLLDNQSATDVYFHERLSGGNFVEIPFFIDIKTERGNIRNHMSFRILFIYVFVYLFVFYFLHTHTYT